MELLLIGTDTPHRRFIINKILDAGYDLTSCIFTKSQVKPKFNVKSPEKAYWFLCSIDQGLHYLTYYIIILLVS